VGTNACSSERQQSLRDRVCYRKSGELVRRQSAGFENFFRELAEVYATDGGPDLARFADLCARYELEMDPESVPGLCERFGVTHRLA
jgi:hypothetical protein